MLLLNIESLTRRWVFGPNEFGKECRLLKVRSTFSSDEQALKAVSSMNVSWQRLISMLVTFSRPGKLSGPKVINGFSLITSSVVLGGKGLGTSVSPWFESSSLTAVVYTTPRKAQMMFWRPLRGWTTCWEVMFGISIQTLTAGTEI